MAFYQKYRPQAFSDLIGQDHISRTLLNAVKSDKLTHAYLLTGPRGTGKTTTARLLAKAINCPEVLSDKNKVAGEPCNTCDFCQEITDGRALDVIEIDAASHTGVDDIRDIIDKARLAPTKSKKKVYIIDEVHMLSKSAFNALLKTLEEPPSHVVFILATTEVHKLPTTILSRTQRYDFKRVTKDEIIKNLKHIAKQEKIEIDDESLLLLALAAAGGHRDSLGLLEQVASLTSKVTRSDVENVLGLSRTSDVLDFLWAIFNSQTEEGLKIAHRLYADGTDMALFCKDVIETLRKAILLHSCGADIIEDTKENIDRLKEIGAKISQEQMLRAITVFIEKGKLFKEVANQLLPVEMAVIELSNPHTDDRQTDNRQQTSQSVIPAKAGIHKKSMDTVDGSQTESGMTEAKESVDLQGTIAQDDKQKNKAEEKKANQHIEETKNQQDEVEIAEPEPDMVSAPVLEMTGDIWDKIITSTKTENATLSALLRDAKPLSMTENKLVLGVKFKFHKDKISEIKNRDILEGIVSKVTGRQYRVSCELHEAKQQKVTVPASDDELQKAAGEVFELEG